MNRKRLILTSVTALALLTSGAVVASALNDVPQYAQPAPNPTADLNRQPVPPPVTVPQEPAPEAAPVALVLRLDAGAPRQPEAPDDVVLAGVKLPLIRLWPDAPALPLRAEWALNVHGLD